MAKVVLSLVGKQGAGKSTIGDRLARYLRTEHIETSDVVRDLNEGKTREELPETGKLTKDDPTWLGEPLYERLQPVFDSGKQTAVLTGVREVEVHEHLRKRGIKLVIVDVTSDPQLRYTRLIELGKVDNANQFLEQELREKELGVNEVIDSSKYEMTTTEGSNPDKLVRALISKIVLEGDKVK